MKSLVFGIALLMAAIVALPLQAAERPAPMIAVASNFMGAMEKIAAAYERATGAKLQMVYSSTGKLYAQIKNGAPYALFLAADARRPELLAEEGWCAPPFIYATGEVVLWSKNRLLAVEKNWQEVVVRADLKKIAISTPEIAPYGAVAYAALKGQGLLSRVEHKLVYGHNVSQPFQFAYHGSTALGFTALSLALSDKGKQGIFWLIPEAEAVVQKGCVVKNSANAEAATKFLDFFQQTSVKTILAEYGYK